MELFLSQLYTGSISNKEIVLRSVFLSTSKGKITAGEILAGDSVMADKAVRGLTLVMNWKNVMWNSKFPQSALHFITGCIRGTL